MKMRKIFGYVFILAGLTIFFLKPISSVTGLAVADNIQSIASGWFYALGLGMIIYGVGVVEHEKRERFRETGLTKIVEQLENLAPSRLPRYENDRKGVENMPPYRLFTARTKEKGDTLCAYASSKYDAANIANHIIQGKTLFTFRDEGLRKYLGSRGRSIYREKLDLNSREMPEELKTKIKDYMKRHKQTKVQLVKVGFGYGERDTQNGRTWERQAHYDSPHEEAGIHFGHYNVEVNDLRLKKHYNLHLLTGNNYSERN